MKRCKEERGLGLILVLVGVAVLTALASAPASAPTAERGTFELTDEAMVELSRQGAAALPELVTLARDPDPYVVRTALPLIGMLGAKAEPAIPTVLELLQHQDAGVQHIAVYTLKSLKPWSTPYVVEALEGASGSRRAALLRVLSRGFGPGAAAAVPALTRALRTGSAEEKTHAAMALASIGKAAEPAIPALEVAVEQVRTQDQRRMIKGCIRRIQDLSGR